jgi:hypothetical protein
MIVFKIMHAASRNIQTHENPNVHSIGQGEAQQKKI